ncbi:hypothetical protein CSB08_01235 [Candidatus Gracilibacteria bacterium]|nr:MAG: hypothetical protein CSB08_01235 [Candidatus Gracilibacteria bacterium]PIE85406.1 MAG: hypothetical protein CSA08_02410 [Candidatus Gracilibacteria bacterium]
MYNYPKHLDLFYSHVSSIEPSILLLIFLIIFVVGIIFGRLSNTKKKSKVSIYDNKHYNFSSNKKRKKFEKKINHQKKNRVFYTIRKLFIMIICIFLIFIGFIVLFWAINNFFENGVYKVVFAFSFFVFMSNILSKLCTKTYDN